MSFINWLAKGSSTLKSTKRETISGTLSIKTYTLIDERVFVVADNALVSYDKGYYETYDRGSNIAIAIKKIVKQKYS